MFCCCGVFDPSPGSSQCSNGEGRKRSTVSSPDSLPAAARAGHHFSTASPHRTIALQHRPRTIALQHRPRTIALQHRTIAPRTAIHQQQEERTHCCNEGRASWFATGSHSNTTRAAFALKSRSTLACFFPGTPAAFQTRLEGKTRRTRSKRISQFIVWLKELYSPGPYTEPGHFGKRGNLKYLLYCLLAEQDEGL